MIKKLIGINYNTSGTSGTSGVSGTTNVTVSTSGTSGSSGTAGTTGTAFVGSQTDIINSNILVIWSKPIGAKVVEVICIGAGGSGGSGSVNNGGRYGGGGGAGGGYSRMIFNASSLPSTVNVFSGRGFGGGARITNSISNGNNGSPGNDSYFGDYLRATGGAGGLGGSSLEASPSIGGYGVIENGGDGGVVVTSDTKYAPSGGGAGGDGSGFGGVDGFAGGTVRLQINTQGFGGGLGLPGSTASSYTNQLMGAGGGGGGAAGTNGSGTNGGDGADGLLYGAGGGGGGSSTYTPDPSVKNSGAGGKGANGVVIVITYF
jgi:hypothetical protein